MVHAAGRSISVQEQYLLAADPRGAENLGDVLTKYAAVSPVISTRGLPAIRNGQVDFSDSYFPVTMFARY